MKNIVTLFLLSMFCGTTLAQVEAGVPPDLIVCDVNNPGDETEVFDLTTHEEIIINGYSNVVVTYHITSGAALSGINALANPESYQNISNPEPIWARLQSTAGQGWSVTSFQLFVPKIPVIATAPDDIFIDEGDGNSVAEFDLTVNEAQMLGGVDPFEFQFSYFTSATDATNNENPIENPEAYTNISNPQVIYGRYEFYIPGCEVVLFDFEIQTDGALGLTDNQAEKLVFAQNPVVGELGIMGLDQGLKYTIQVLDLSGQVVLSVDTANRDNIQLNVASLAPAVYLVQMSDGERLQTGKFVKR